MSGESAGVEGAVVSRRLMWTTFAIAILNHLVLDPVLTVYRSATNPWARELNPLWSSLLETDPLLFLLIQIPVILVLMGAYALVLWSMRRADPPWDARLARFAWWGTIGILLWGLLVTAHHVLFLLVRT